MRTEYEYFVRLEKAHAEQQALRQQMRQEAEERKALEIERKKMEKEESKYETEIPNVQQQLEACADDEKCAALRKKIEELQAQLSSAAEQKEQIISRQNGKAGYVYIIGNLGSFGENIFKIGMARRLDSMDRVKEPEMPLSPFLSTYIVLSFRMMRSVWKLSCIADSKSIERTKSICARSSLI